MKIFLSLLAVFNHIILPFLASFDIFKEKNIKKIVLVLHILIFLLFLGLCYYWLGITYSIALLTLFILFSIMPIGLFSCLYNWSILNLIHRKQR